MKPVGRTKRCSDSGCHLNGFSNLDSAASGLKKALVRFPRFRGVYAWWGKESGQSAFQPVARFGFFPLPPKTSLWESVWCHHGPESVPECAWIAFLKLQGVLGCPELDLACHACNEPWSVVVNRTSSGCRSSAFSYWSVFFAALGAKPPNHN